MHHYYSIINSYKGHVLSSCYHWDSQCFAILYFQSKFNLPMDQFQKVPRSSPILIVTKDSDRSSGIRKHNHLSQNRLYNFLRYVGKVCVWSEEIQQPKSDSQRFNISQDKYVVMFLTTHPSFCATVMCSNFLDFYQERLLLWFGF